MVTKLNPSVITDDMMYEGRVAPYTPEELSADLSKIKDDKLWGEIRRAAKTNSTLQSAMDECIIIYKLSKEYKDGI